MDKQHYQENSDDKLKLTDKKVNSVVAKSNQIE